MLNKINKRRVFISVLAILLGVAMAVFSEYDDAPGGILLGFLITLAGFFGIRKSKIKTPDA